MPICEHGRPDAGLSRRMSQRAMALRGAENSMRRYVLWGICRLSEHGSGNMQLVVSFAVD